MHNDNLQNVLGNCIDINLNQNLTKNYSEIRADIPVTQYKSIRLWGQVKDSNNNHIPYALLKLIKYSNGAYSGVAHTTADCHGFYQFDLCVDDACEYKIIASKSNTGAEYTMQGNGNCPTNQYDPCSSSSPFSLIDYSVNE